MVATSCNGLTQGIKYQLNISSRYMPAAELTRSGFGMS